MHAAREFRRQRRINHAMAFDAALSPEGRGHNINAKVRFAFGPMAGMAPVLVGFVHHVETFGGESFSQLSRDYIFCSHGTGRKRHFANCQDLKQAAALPHNRRL